MNHRLFILPFLAIAVCLVCIDVGMADDVDITYEGHFGGITDAVVVSGNYAYINQGEDFIVLDISNPEAPSELGRLATDGIIKDINVSGSYAYVADSSTGLLIIDISNPATTTLTGSYDTAGDAYSVAVSGSYAYIADYSNGLVIIDISNPAAPILTGSYDTAGDARGVAVSGSYAYVSDGSNGLVIIDISNPAAPTLAGIYNTAGYALSIAVSGSYAFVVADSYDGLVIIDISNPAAPTLAGSYDIAEDEFAVGVAISGSYAYVADGYNSLLIINISNPAAPTLAGSCDTAGWAHGVAVSGSYAYVADGYGLVIIDISNPAAPTFTGSYSYCTAGYALSIAVSGSHAYVAAGSGLVIIDISNPAAPTLAGSYNTAENTYNVAVLGSYAYVTHYYNGLVIINISNPAAPIFAGSYDTAEHGGGVAVSGSYAYVSDGCNGLVIIDISNPAAPTLAGSYKTAGEACNVAVSGSYAYVYTDTNGLVIIDISNPATPTFAGSYNTAGYVRGVAVSGSYAYVTDSYGLVIIDISNPAVPTLAGSYDTAGYAQGVAVSGSYAYVADYNNGLVILSTNIPPQASIQDKTLLQVEGQPEVYWLQNDRLYWVTDWNVIDQMSGIPGWDNVNTLPASEFNPMDYEQGPRFITTGAESDGLLIRQVGDYKVYRIENGMKRHITYPDVMDLKGYSFDDVIEVSSEISNMFQVGEPVGIEVDLYFNKKTDSGDISHVSQFTNGETVKSITETIVSEDYNVETYVKMIKPDGTVKYAYYENVDFLITDALQFSDTERSLYPGTWHAQTKTWNWDEYTFAGDETEGVYTWEFWYEDVASGKVLGKDVQGYEFTNAPSDPVDIIPPYIVLISPLDVTFNRNEIISAIAYDPSGIQTYTVTVNGKVISWGFSDTIYTFIELNEGLNEITISATDNSENHNERTEGFSVYYYPFDVKINSPNNMDRYTPEESMNIYGEVTGGTPSFTYKWIIDELNSIGEIQNHVEYSGFLPDGSIELPVLESSIYEIQLEVTDSKGFTIKTEQRIIISPQDVNSGFLPNPNGYQFVNFGSEGYSWMVNSPADPLLLMQTTGGYSWDYFRRAYGSDEVEINGIPSLWAKNFFNRLYTEVGNPGNCFGMSASSLVIYHLDNNRNNFNSWDLAGSTDLPFFGRNRPLDSDDSIFDYNDNGIWDPAPRTWGIFPDFIYTPTEWVEYYHPLQCSAASVEDKVTYGNPSIVYNELKHRMASDNWIQNPMVIGGGGHAVVPLRIYESNNHRTGIVFIYDNLHPGDNNRNILFDLIEGTATYIDVDWSDVAAVQLSSFQRDDHQMSNSDSVNNWAGHLLYTDAIGRHLGFYNGEFEDEIPGTSIINSWGQNENDQFMETYYISNLNLKRELYGVNNGIATVSISRPNNLVIADVQVSPNSVDELNVPADGSSVEFISGEGTSSIGLMLDRENTEFARVVRITGSEIESGNGVQLSFSDDLDKVSIMNKGLPHGYDLYLEQIGSNPSSYNSLRPIVVEENSAVWITPLDWNDIVNNAILIEYDSGNDGTIESSEMINTYNITFLPPITTMDQFNLTDGSTLPIRFTVRDSITNEFIYDDTVNVTITNSTGHLITYFTNGTGTGSVRINSEEEQYIANFHTKDYAINIREIYSVTVTFGEPDSLRGYDITYFTLIEGGKAKGKGN